MAKSFKEFLVDTATQSLERNLPIEDLKSPKLPCYAKFALGFVAYAILVGLFVYSFASNYMAATNEKFISLDMGSGNCKEIPRPLSGSFMLDTHGNWEGSPDFKLIDARYEIIFDRFDGGIDGFEHNIQRIGGLLDDLNSTALLTPLWISVLIFMGFQKTASVNGKLQTFRFTGSPREVFRSEMIYAGIASAAGACNTNVEATFESNSGIMKISWNYGQYISDANCTKALDPSFMNADFLEKKTPSTFELEYQIETLVTAIAVNSGILDVMQLSLASKATNAFSVNGTMYVFIGMFYERYPTMDKLWCILPIDNDGNYFNPPQDEYENYPFPPVCLMKSKVGVFYFLPTLSHMFDGCNSCPPASSSRPIFETSAICDEFLFYVSVITFQGDPYTSGMKLFNFISSAFKKSVLFLGDNSFLYYYGMMADVQNAAYMAVYSNSSEFPNNAFDFCDNSCTVLSFGTIKTLDPTNPSKHDLNKAGLSFPIINCQNLYTTDNWNKFLIPPIPMIEIYYECTKFSFDAFNDALGVASGFASSLASVAFILFIPLIYLFKKERSRIPSKEDVIDDLGQELVDLVKLNQPVTNEDVVKLINSVVNSSENICESNNEEGTSVEITSSGVEANQKFEAEETTNGNHSTGSDCDSQQPHPIATTHLLLEQL